MTDESRTSIWISIRKLVGPCAIRKFSPLKSSRASYHDLLRVPGIGVVSARRICAARRQAFLSYDSLKRLGVVLKRARYFITCKGKYYGLSTDPAYVRRMLLSGQKQPSAYEPMSLF